MKLIAILMTAAFLQVSARGDAQLIMISGKNISLEQIFTKIERQSQYVFFYDETALQKAKLVSVNVKNSPLAKVLDECFKDQPLYYNIVGKTIVVNNNVLDEKAPVIAPAPPPLLDITGKVTDQAGKPLAGVSIAVSGENRGVSTDDRGNFRISVNEDASLTFSYVGYKTFTIAVKGKTTIDITMTL